MADTDNTPQGDAPPASQDLKQLQELYDLMEKESLESLELQDKNTHIRLQRAHPGGSHDSHHRPHAAQHHAPAPVANKASTSPSNAPSIKTPLAGIFYRASSPASPPYVKEGSTVEAGQTLCIVEAMKVMNEIKAESRCRIVKILAENARPVTAEQALFEIEPE